VRQALARTITSALRSGDGLIPVMTFDPKIERLIRERAKEGAGIEPQEAQRILSSVQSAVETFTKRGHLPVLLTGAAVRRHLRQLLGRYLPQIAVLSHAEIADGVKIQSLGIIRCQDDA
jgi:flagellar biosynthesis protein FlhA